MSINCNVCGKELKNSQALAGHNRFAHNIFASKYTAQQDSSSILERTPLSEQINEFRTRRQLRPLEEHERLAIELENKKMWNELYSRSVETNETNINQLEIEQLKNELNDLKGILVKEKAKRNFAKKEDLTDYDEDEDDYDEEY